jgi:hypothetical protein
MRLEYQFGSYDEVPAPNFHVAGRRKKNKNVLHHFRYEVTVYAIETQGVSFILFVSKEALSHINPAFVAMFFDIRQVWDAVNKAYSWHYWSQKVGKYHILPNIYRPFK